MKGICSMSQLGRKSLRWKITLNFHVGQGGFYVPEKEQSLKSNFPFVSLCLPNYLLSKNQTMGEVNQFGESCSIKLFNHPKRN